MSSRQHLPPPTTRAGQSRSAPVLCGSVAALLVVRWLIPAEGVERGDQLWIPAAWSVIAGVWCWLAPAPRRPLSWVDAGMALVIAGHLLGGGTVYFAGGNFRQAANLMVEWWGLGCAWVVVRELALAPEWALPVRRALLAVAATTAALGIYQHYWGLPQSVREIAPAIERLRSAASAESRLAAARKLSRHGIPTTEPALTLFEKRLRDSREPFGFFALANTLGGLLGASLVWGLAVAIYRPVEPPPPTDRAKSGLRWSPLLLMVAWCLALTKSRTAWVGTAVGLVLAGGRCLFADPKALHRPAAADSEPSQPLRSRWWTGAAVAAVLLGLAVWGLFQTGGWDADVLREAPKSLSYRGQYWTGALRLIGESPVLGIGLGQFRPEYLRVKLPEASEEIADPHNLLLDAWVNGGLLATVGLLVIAGGVVWNCRIGGNLPSFQPFANASAGWIVGIGGVAAFGLAFASELVLDGGWDDRYFVLAAVWCLVYGFLLPLSQTAVVGTGSALAALGVHLLGAGGLEMPAVVQTAWVWLSLASASQPTAIATAPERRLLAGLTPFLGGLLILTVVWRPVLAARSDLLAGDLAVQRGDSRSALNAYARAAESDPWDPVPPMRSGELQSEIWRQMTPGDPQFSSADSEPFRAAVAHFDEARRRNPRSSEADRRIGELWLYLHERSHDPQHAAHAVDWLTRAAAGYPTNADLLVEWSDALAAAGDATASRQAAQQAMKQDDINRKLGHVERVLPASTRRQLEIRLGDDLSR